MTDPHAATNRPNNWWRILGVILVAIIAVLIFVAYKNGMIPNLLPGATATPQPTTADNEQSPFNSYPGPNGETCNDDGGGLQAGANGVWCIAPDGTKYLPSVHSTGGIDPASGCTTGDSFRLNSGKVLCIRADGTEYDPQSVRIDPVATVPPSSTIEPNGPLGVIVDPTTCGAPLDADGVSYQYVINFPVGGDQTLWAAGTVAEAGHKVAVIVPAKMSADFTGSSMSGRIWQFAGSGTLDQIVCYMNAIVGEDPGYYKWLVEGEAEGWSNNPPSDWETQVKTMVDVDLVELSGVEWTDPTPVDANDLTIGGDNHAWRFELWVPGHPRISWDGLVAPNCTLTVPQGVQGMSWGVAPITASNWNQLVVLAEQQSYVHQNEDFLETLYLMMVSDEDWLPDGLLSSENLSVVGNRWRLWTENDWIPFDLFDVIPDTWEGSCGQ